MSGALAASTSNLAGLSNVLQQLFLGGNKTESGTSTKTDATTTTSSVRSDQGVIDQLQELFTNALSNAKNPEAVKPVVENILRQAQLAFAPQLAKEAQSGLYNTTARKQLADQAVADATGASAQAVLNYVTNQQQIAGQTGNTLANAAKTTAATQTGTQTGTQATRINTAPAIPSNISSIAGLGLAGYSLYKNKAKLLDKLGLGNISSAWEGGSPAAAAEAATAGASPFVTPGEVGTAGAPVFNFTESLDGVSGPIPGLEGISVDATSVADSLASGATDFFGGAVTDVTDFFSGATDLGFAELPDINSLFDFSGMEELSSFLPDLGGEAFDITGILGETGGFFDDVFEILGGIF